MQPISVACFDQDIWIRVTGRGNFKCSGALKQLVQEMMSKGYYHYVIDLKNCEQIDSTFMGTVTGIAQRLRPYQQALFKVVNVSQSNQELMENLGLNQLFSIQALCVKNELPPDSDSNCFYEPSALSCSLADKTTVQEIVVSAHEALIAADQKNAEKFKDVLDVLH